MEAKRIDKLSSLSPGTRFRVVEISVGPGLRARLIGLGITLGAEGVVLYNGGEHIVINVRGVDIAISRGQASKIFVEIL